MKRKFTYNPVTCQFEPVFLTGKKLFKKISLFCTLSLATAIAVASWYLNRFSPIEEQFLQQRNKTLKLTWETLHHQIDQANDKLDQLIDQDENNYRVILDLQLLGKDVREAGVGGIKPGYLSEVEEYRLITETYKRVKKLAHQVDVEKQSFDELTSTTDNKLTMWASRPAIQPINNKELSRLHTTFGLRLHPIFNVFQDHKGLDFSAPKGTPVYATADGRVSMAYYSSSYGNVIFVDHGFDFETRYAHLYQFTVRQGQFVKRGELIGYVGNTGISASPHLHYEVLFKGLQINPINFFQRDLSNAEYEKLISMADHSVASLD